MSNSQVQSLQKLLHHVPGMVYQFQRLSNGHFCLPYVSRGIGGIFELTPQDVLYDAKPAFARVHHDDLDGLMESIRVSGETMSLWRHDFRVCLPQRGERWLHGTSRPEKQDDGSILWHGYVNDMTERKAMEASLREFEARWTFALEGAGDGVWDWNFQDGTAFLSKRWKEMLGYSEDEIGNSAEEWIKRLHPDDVGVAMDALQQHIDGKTPAIFVHNRLLCKDGSYKWIEGRGSIVTRDAAGRPVRLVGSNRDISDVIQAQQQVRDAQADLQATLNAIPDCLFEVGLDGRFYMARTVSPHPCIGKLVSDILSPEAAENFLAALRQANETGISTGKQFSMGAGAQTQWFEISVARKERSYPDGPHFIVVSREVTQSKQQQAQIEADHIARRDALVREVHHRVNNNLQGIGGLLRQMAHHHAGMQPVVTQVLSQLHSIAAIHGLQARSRPEQVFLAGLVQAVAGGVASIWNAAIDVNVDPSWIPCLLAHNESVPVALVLNELMVNAVKHGDQALGGVRVALHASGGPAPAASIHITNAGTWPPPDKARMGLGLQFIQNLLPRRGINLNRQERDACVCTTLVISAPVVSFENSTPP